MILYCMIADISFCMCVLSFLKKQILNGEKEKNTKQINFKNLNIHFGRNENKKFGLSFSTCHTAASPPFCNRNSSQYGLQVAPEVIVFIKTFKHKVLQYV